MADTAALRIHIEGRVQAVGVRYWLLGQAVSLGLDGWVRNLRHGRLEAAVSGPPPCIKMSSGQLPRGQTAM